jgi:hypothetical protein
MNAEKIRLVQLDHPRSGRRIALVREPDLLLLEKFRSVYELAMAAIDTGVGIQELIGSRLSKEMPDYASVYEGRSEWRLLPSFDHPDNPFACLVSGTGLTHKNSALNRQMMHATDKSPQPAADKPTDSMQIYQWGLEGGSPPAGTIGVQPEWFYKGNGFALRAHGQSLEIPPYANDGGEEPEIAGIYVVDRKGNPRRVGFSTGNEFSDHVMEKKNYLYLAPSKLRQCAIGPELLIDADFAAFTGEVSILRKEQVLWSAAIRSGEDNMAHNLRNLEYHHFKYAAHRVPFQAHVHFFGADAFSFGQQVKLQEDDVMKVEWKGLGRPLLNPLKIAKEEEQWIEVNAL